MTFIPNPNVKNFEISDIVYLTENFVIDAGTFTKDHMFRIFKHYWKTQTVDLIDDDNRKLFNVGYKWI